MPEATAAAAALAAAALQAVGTFRRGHRHAAGERIALWSAAQRRVAALRVHFDAARSSGPPDPGPAEAVTLLDRYGVDWSRTDLVWSLYVLADGSGLCCRSDHRLPAILPPRRPRPGTGTPAATQRACREPHRSGRRRRPRTQRVAAQADTIGDVAPYRIVAAAAGPQHRVRDPGPVRRRRRQPPPGHRPIRLPLAGRRR